MTTTTTGNSVAVIRLEERTRVLAALQDAGSDYDAQNIEELAIKAALWVKCPSENCGAASDATDKQCLSCGTELPEVAK